MLVSVLTGGSPPPEPEIWGKVKEIHLVISFVISPSFSNYKFLVSCVDQKVYSVYEKVSMLYN